MPKKKSFTDDNKKNWIVRLTKQSAQVDVFTLQNMAHANAQKFADKYLANSSDALGADGWEMDALK